MELKDAVGDVVRKRPTGGNLLLLWGINSKPKFLLSSELNRRKDEREGGSVSNIKEEREGVQEDEAQACRVT